MPGTWNKPWSGETPSGQWLGPSTVERVRKYTGDEKTTPTSGGACWRAMGLGAEQPGRSATQLGQGARQPCNGAWQHNSSQQGKAPRGPLRKKEPEPIENVPLDPQFVLRVLLPLSSSSMGPGWWKNQVDDAHQFGVRITWQCVYRAFNGPMYARPLQHM